MGWIDRTTKRLEKFAERMEEKQRNLEATGTTKPPDLRGEPSILEDDDIDAFLAAGEEGQRPRAHKPPPSFEEYLRLKDPVRVFALKRHIKWVKKEARKWGLDEDRIGWWLL